MGASLQSGQDQQIAKQDMDDPRNPKLEAALNHKRQLLEARKREIPIRGVRAQASLQPRPQDIASVLKNGHVSLLTEVKRASPSGLLVQEYDPVALAQQYERFGAAALSVATDETMLHGGLSHLMRVRRAVSLPVFRQDFIFDEYQIAETRAAGADGVRIIAAILGDTDLWNLLSLTQRMKMTALMEVQSEPELDRVLSLDPRLIGIQNRNWLTGAVDLTLTERLRPKIPSHITVVSGGGIRTAQDVQRMAVLNVVAVAIGEALLTANSPAAKFGELLAAI